MMCSVVLCPTILKCYRNATYHRTGKFRTQKFSRLPAYDVSTERKVEDIVIEQLPKYKCTWTLGTKLPQ